MAPGIPLVGALPNVIATVGIGMDGKTTAFQGTVGCECVGGECGAAERKRDRNNNDASTQHELGIHHEFLFVSRPTPRWLTQTHQANHPSVCTAAKQRRGSSHSGRQKQLRRSRAGRFGQPLPQAVAASRSLNSVGLCRSEAREDLHRAGRGVPNAGGRGGRSGAWVLLGVEKNEYQVAPKTQPLLDTQTRTSPMYPGLVSTSTVTKPEYSSIAPFSIRSRDVCLSSDCGVRAENPNPASGMNGLVRRNKPREDHLWRRHHTRV